MRIVLLGPPGAGKGTQAQALAQRLRVPHIASGDLLRDHQARGSPLGLMAKRYMEQGLLVPDQVVIQMIIGRLAQEDCQRGFLLDGFPRTLEQAQALEQALGERGINLVLYIRVAAQELVRRLSGRSICRNCQAPYHAVTAPPKVAGRCDRCGGELYQREDDKPEAVGQRIRVFEAQTAPLVEHYRGQGKLFEVDGEQSIEAVGDRLVEVVSLGKRGRGLKSGASQGRVR